MAMIRPFRAVRPAEAYASRVAALPYDVYKREEAAMKVRNDPLLFLNIDRPETQFPPDTDMYSDVVYRKANMMIRNWFEKGIFIRDEENCLYTYSLTMEGRTQTGIVALTPIDDYINGVILKHENTREDKELDRIRHIDVTSCQTGPIFLTYRDENEINTTVRQILEKKPIYDFVTEDGIRHTVRKISDILTITRLASLFGGVRNLYIADGHHRAASAVKVGLKRREAHPDYTGREEFNYFLSVIFPESELKILEVNRVVKDLNGYTEESFLRRITEDFLLEEIFSEADVPYRPRRRGEFGLLLGGHWYRLTARSEIRSDDPVKGLDVSILQDYVLEPILGIHDPKTDTRIDFIGGIRGLRELERRTQRDMKIAFSLFPTSMDDLLNVADHGRLMPPKCTWFEPKLRSGLFLHPIER